MYYNGLEYQNKSSININLYSTRILPQMNPKRGGISMFLFLQSPAVHFISFF